jgi:hypothetical protein
MNGEETSNREQTLGFVADGYAPYMHEITNFTVLTPGFFNSARFP